MSVSRTDVPRPRSRSRQPWPLIFSVLAIVGLSCSSLDNIEVPVTGEATIPMRSVLDELIGTIEFEEFQDVSIKDSQTLQNQGYSEDQIDGVRILEMRLVIVDPANSNFDFLDGIRFYAEAEGLPKVLVAELDPVPTGVSSIDLVVDSSIELRPYVVADSMTLTTEGSGTRPAEETQVEAEAIFDIDINVTSACN
ncbi:hypothetical protein [Haliangium ochraceum]|uniref:Lipoprotein n=1 Tax=Haliangium ochraceum (strain DSM 14365 / JCM 11303 / SMP-2) TaxID=502025 RepID=D0LRL0_HALO1|nr:hypothetical protein [Haliangium ochraceum]ACY19002.1 conserved hypothetical protein [Haliangium ochraceum DSM 14365]